MEPELANAKEEEKQDIVIKTAGGKQKRPFEDECRTLEHLFRRDGRMQISLKERMQSANKAWWRHEDIPLPMCNLKNHMSKSM